MRRAIAPMAVGAVAIAAALLLAWIGRAPFMPAYLAAWLLWGGVPVGALAVVLLRSAYGVRVASPARGIAIGMPVAALGFIPVLIWMRALYPWVAGSGPGTPWGRIWLGQGAFIFRTVAYWVAFCALAWWFAARRRAGERVAALAAAFVFAILATLASFDWIMSLEPSMHSGEFGLLILASAVATVCALGLLVGALIDAAEARTWRWWLGASSAVWAYLHFMQFLVMWSADLPSEAAWYLRRDAGPGRGFEWFGFIAGFVLPVSLLLPVRLPRIALAGFAGLALMAHAGEAIWFVVPSTQLTALSGAAEALLMVGAGLAIIGAVLLGSARERAA